MTSESLGFRRALLILLTPLAISGPVSAAQSLRIEAVRIAGAPVVGAEGSSSRWTFESGPAEWHAGEGVMTFRAEDDVLVVEVDQNGGSLLLGSNIAADREAVIRVVFSEIPPVPIKRLAIQWDTASGVRVDRSYEPVCKERVCEVDLSNDLFWYGNITGLSLGLPGLPDEGKYRIEAIAVDPRSGPYLHRRRVQIEPYQLARVASPFESRDGMMLPPDSACVAAVRGLRRESELRFGLGVASSERSGQVGGFDGTYTTFLRLVVSNMNTGETVATESIPILLENPRWMDFRYPLTEGDVKIEISFEDSRGTAVAIVSDLRVTEPALPSRLALLVTVDTLRRSSLSLYGHHRLTPGLDRIGLDGVFFNNAYAQGPNTTASMLALLTSLYPSQAPWSGVRPGQPSLPETLGSSGFRTVLITGNIHVQADYMAAGFDQVIYVSQEEPRGTHVLADHLRRILRLYEGEDLFVLAHFLDPHAPYESLASAGTYSRIDQATTDSWVAAPGRLLHGGNKQPLVPAELVDPNTLEQMMSLYDEEVLDVSNSLTTVWELLKSQKRYDDALIILTADHGEEFYEHGGILHGGRGLFNEVIHIPLAVKPPQGARGFPDEAGVGFDHPVELIDIYPTIVATLDIPPPPHLKGNHLANTGQDFAIAEVAPIYLRGGEFRRALVTERFKLIVGRSLSGDGMNSDLPMLFDLSEDPLESRNVAEDYPDLVRELQARLSLLLEAEKAP